MEKRPAWRGGKSDYRYDPERGALEKDLTPPKPREVIIKPEPMDNDNEY